MKLQSAFLFAHVLLTCFVPYDSLGHDAKKRRIKILAVDGGGIRGIIASRILEEIENRSNGKRIHELFDHMAGVSSGAITIAALNYRLKEENGIKRPYTAKEVTDLYRRLGEKVFCESFLGVVRRVILFNMSHVKYDSAKLATYLQEIFGNTALSEGIKPFVVITYALRKGRSKVWSRDWARKETGHNEDILLKDLLLATSAAPTYFNPVILSGNYKHEDQILIDGGVVSNNPLSAAISDIAHNNSHALSHKKSSIKNREDVLIVSIGTGDIESNHDNCQDWGVFSWLTKGDLINMTIAATSGWTDKVMEYVYGKSYYRVPGKYRKEDPNMGLLLKKEEGKMDLKNPEQIEELLQRTEKYIEYNDQYIQTICDELNED